ncbi:hypothetical protein [Alicyclobacillus acidocaldarius]|uniref:Uncharacterized protein n=1 Tax=Alicyclobacillus acidocaldarius (strain Tc-4-1) TaxID=1048834 RepID=F8IFK8_ALIAT|nr:hypothetical protein [Alicyclobacillus acidocaldarius]AEJ44092.1 hypothetical protein TC41_2186 [Alicyclobacillus acidocaldarius subsp. acidocaldarius Tc-4-1]
MRETTAYLIAAACFAAYLTWRLSDGLRRSLKQRNGGDEESKS